MTTIPKTKKLRGRPPVDTKPVTLRLPIAMIAAVDKAVRAEPQPPPSRPEMIRRMMADWLRERGYLPK
jgi:hypothetical protein